MARTALAVRPVLGHMETIAATATNAQLFERAEVLNTEIGVRQGQLLEVVGELDRRQAFRDEGATSTAAWLTERFGLSDASARSLVALSAQLYEHPVFGEAMRSGEISLDKARAAADLATASDSGRFVTDAEVLEQARQSQVRDLAQMTRSSKGTSDADSLNRHDRRYLRCNDTKRTISAQLPDDQYALVRSALEREAARVKSDGETPHDQRMADALVRICRQGRAQGDSGNDILIVAHADLSLLRGGAGRAELERQGLISPEAARRLACDAQVALAIDDAFGHTMVEGRAQRFPTDQQRREVWRRDRACRFPGCANSLFTNVHHIVHWVDGGMTDLDNLVLLCNHHHHTVHEGRWQISGNPNGILKFLGPTKRAMTSKPSPLWTRRN